MIGALGPIICLAGCGHGQGEIAPDVIARVGNASITKTTFEHWMRVQATESETKQHGRRDTSPVIPEPPDYTACVAHLREVESSGTRTEAEPRLRCEMQYKELRKHALGFLISLDWELGQAKAIGIELDGEAIKIPFELLKKARYHTQAKFRQYLASTGQTEADYLLQFKLEMLVSEINARITSELTKRVHEASIVKYYKEHELSYDTPETRDVQIVLTKTEEQAMQAKREIGSGKGFRSVAIRESIDPGVKADGGVLKGVFRGEDEQAFTNAVFAAKVGVLGGPVQTPFGYYVYEVKAVHPPNNQTFAQARSTARTALVAEESKAIVAEVQRKWQAVTKCRPEYVNAEYCGGRI